MIAIVGAGMGGLATAARLAKAGERVVVFEKNAQCGGRNQRVRVGSVDFDSGPTLLMMLDPFRRLYGDLDLNFDSRLSLTKIDPGYRAFFSDGSWFDAHTDVAQMVAQFSTRDGQEYVRYMGDLKALYEASIPHFVERNYNGLGDMFSLAQIRRALGAGMLSNLGKVVQRRFKDPRVQMLLSFQSLYLGLSPFDAPFVYATLSYMELGAGIYYPVGGLSSISEDLVKICQELGVQFQVETEVTAVGANWVRTRGGETIAAKAVVCNADLPYVRAELMGEPVKKKNSCSAFLWMLDTAQTLDLPHHSFHFGSEFRENLDAIFRWFRLPEDPSFYVCQPPTGGVFILVPVSNLSMPWTDSVSETLKHHVAQRLHLDLSQVVAERVVTPVDWNTDFNLYEGAAFGLSHHLLQSAYFRPSNVHRGVYFVGASTVPGNGLPMVTISAELVVERLRRDGKVTSPPTRDTR